MISEFDNGPPRLSDTDCQKIVLAALAACDPEAVEQVCLERLLDWANVARMDYAMLQLILDGKLVVDPRPDDCQDWVFKSVANLHPALRRQHERAIASRSL